MRPHAKRVLVTLAIASMIAIGRVVCLAARTNAAAADVKLVDR